MQRMMWRGVLRLLRVLSLALLAVLGTTALTRFAPGYFTDGREMDAAHANGANTQLTRMRSEQGALTALLKGQVQGLAHGDLGQSRQYDVPVSDLLRARIGASGRLLGRGLLGGWLLACCAALPLCARRGSRGEALITGSTALLLALPVGVLATLSLLLDTGGPVSVLALLVAVREFKLVYALLRVSWRAPFLLYGRAQGLGFARLMFFHLTPTLARELLALGMMSLAVALSALVPIEVVFDLPGLGQLAWSAAMNRDLPVLVAVTALLSICVGVAGVFGTPARGAEVATCA